MFWISERSPARSKCSGSCWRSNLRFRRCGKVREGAGTHKYQLVEYIRQQGALVHLEVEAGLVHETQDLAEDEPHRFGEERVQH